MNSFPLITIYFVTYPTILIKGIPIQTNQDHDRSLCKIHENVELLKQVLRYNLCLLAAYQCLY